MAPRARPAALRRPLEAQLTTLGQRILDAPGSEVIRGWAARAPGGFYAELLRVFHRRSVIARARARGLIPGSDASGHAAASARLAAEPALAPLFDPERTPRLAAVTLEELGEPPTFEGGPTEGLGWDHQHLLGFTAEIEGSGHLRLRRARAQGSRRRETSSYYTPAHVVEALLDHTLEPLIEALLAAEPRSPRPGADPAARELDLAIVDPACGTGHLLLAAARRLAARLAPSLGEPEVRGEGGGPASPGLACSPWLPRAAPAPPARAPGDPGGSALQHVIERCVFGLDADPDAVALASAGLWLEVGVPGARPARLAVGDAVLGSGAASLEAALGRDRFDCVLANPPWASHVGRQRDRRLAPEALVARYPALARWPALHAAFLLRTTRLLGPRGRAGLILPLQVADLEAYAALRAEVRQRATLARPVLDLGESAFAGVTQPAGIFTFAAGAEPAPSRAPWPIDGGAAVEAGREELLLRLEEHFAKRPTFPRGSFADPGVHTGNVGRRIVGSAPPPGPTLAAPIREGRDVVPFACLAPRRWLELEPPLAAGEYCTIHPEARYRRFPILLRQTADRPIAGRHTPPTYFRNSLLACAGVPDLPDLWIVAFANSSLYACLHRSRARDARQKTFPQVKVRHLEALPLPPRHLVASPIGAALTAAAERAEREALTSGAAEEATVAALDALVLEAFDLPRALAPQLAAWIRGGRTSPGEGVTLPR